MYTLSRRPTKADCIMGKLYKGDMGVVGVKNDSAISKLFPGALDVLQRLYLGEFGDIKIALASSADTPLASTIARDTLNLLEVLPGVTVQQAISKHWLPDFTSHMQIGRQHPLSGNKAKSHFPILHQATGIPYS